MKKTLLLVITALLLLPIFSACGSQQSPTSDLYSSSKPYTRWWWFSSDIDVNDVRDQLVWLKNHEFGGVEIAWIYPMFLDSAASHPTFLSPEWAAPVQEAKRIADSLGLGCDFTYGTLWPFSDINLPDGDQTRTYFDSIHEAERSFTWDFPLQARILNHLDSNAFFRYADKMNRGLGKAYKGSASGLFVDSWEVETQYLWTPGFEKTFMAEHGYDIEPYMQQRTLLDTANLDVFYDYMHTLSRYVLNQFYAPFADNARRVGAFSRAQCGGAPTDLLTAFSLVDVPETEAILYEPCFSKIPASAAALANKSVVTSETFTCTYGWTGLLYKKGHGHSPYQGKEQIADLKLICDALFANGINQIIWHGFPYNKVGDTSNFFYTTCQISTSPLNNLTGDNLKQFNQYMTRVSDYMRRGHTYSDLAVYMPLEDAWMGGYYPDSLRKVKAFFWGQYEMRFINTPQMLRGLQPLWVNEHFLSSASYTDGTLHCGAANFKALYVDVEYMEMDALQHIVRLAQQGLPVCLKRNPREPGHVHHPQYETLLAELQQCANVSADETVIPAQPLIEGNNLPDFWCRQQDDNYYVFFANPLCQTIEYPLQYGYAFTDSGSQRTITVNHHGKSETYTLDFHPTESLLIEITPSGIRQVDLAYTPQVMPGL
ncbi:MAG: hypothetical protein IJ761_05330 [Bacteroidales bacterium]|nr:hypothetical protein [Bacteroidales bacterium]